MKNWLNRLLISFIAILIILAVGYFMKKKDQSISDPERYEKIVTLMEEGKYRFAEKHLTKFSDKEGYKNTIDSLSTIITAKIDSVDAKMVEDVKSKLKSK